MTREDTRAYLRTVESAAEFASDRDISLSDVFEAQARAYPNISVEGIYLRIQAAVVRFTGPLGGVLLTVLGVASLVILMKRAGGWLLGKLRTTWSGFALFFGPGLAVGAGLAAGNILMHALSRAIGDSTVRDEQDDKMASAINALLNTMIAVSPAPMGALVAATSEVIDSALAGTSSTTPTSHTTSALTSPLTTSLTPFGQIASSLAPAIGPAGTAAGLATQILSSGAGQSVVSGVVDWIGGLFGDRYVEADEEERNLLASTLKQTLLQHGCSEPQAAHIVETLKSANYVSDRYTTRN